MLRLMTLLKTLSLCFLFLLVGCPDAPVKPQKLNEGQIDCSKNEMIVGVSGVGMTGREPICPKWDKATSFPPADFALQNAYVKKLEKYAQFLEGEVKDLKLIISNGCN